MKKLTILVSSNLSVGHVTACAGALSTLQERGHRVIFLLNKSFEGKLAKLGYEEYIMPTDETLSKKYNKDGKTAGAAWAEFLYSAKIIGPNSPKEKAKIEFNIMDRDEVQHLYMYKDKCVQDAIALFKPDLIYVDFSRLPAILYSGIPWILNISSQPLSYCWDDETLPPGGSGLPTDGDRTEWAEWSKLRCKKSRYIKMNNLNEKMGYPRYPDDMFPQTQILTVYAVPEEINYPQIRAKESWFNIEVFNKSDKSKQAVNLDLIVPKEFLNSDLDGKFSGKFIYFSLGSMGAIDLDLMKRLIAKLSKTNHKYIVSKGPRHSELELEPNMWGEEFLPQIVLIPHVDLVITHGGNNTVTEVFAEGKPMIVLPLFGDQYNNAQRLQETGYGARIDAYNFQDGDLIGAIDKILGDANLHKKLKAASERIQAQNNHKQLALKIEGLLN